MKIEDEAFCRLKQNTESEGRMAVNLHGKDIKIFSAGASPEMARQGEFFALQVKGDSMEPKFSDGDVVIVRKQEDVDSGDIAIILVNGDEATIKKVQKFDGGINLVPTNSAYPVLTYTNKEIEQLPVRVIGKVVELRAKF